MNLLCSRCGNPRTHPGISLCRDCMVLPLEKAYQTLETEDLPAIHDHRPEAYDSETGQYPCGCGQEVFPQ